MTKNQLKINLLSKLLEKETKRKVVLKEQSSYEQFKNTLEIFLRPKGQIDIPLSRVDGGKPKAVNQLLASVPKIEIPLPGTVVQKRQGWEMPASKGIKLLAKSTAENLKRLTIICGAKWSKVYISPRLQLGNGFGPTKVVYSFTILGKAKDGTNIALDRRESPSVGGGTTLVCRDGFKPEKITYFLYANEKLLPKELRIK